MGVDVVNRVKNSNCFPSLTRDEILAALQYKAVKPVERDDGKKGVGLKPELLVQLKTVLEGDGEMPVPTTAPTSAPGQAPVASVTPAASQDNDVQAMDTT